MGSSFILSQISETSFLIKGLKMSQKFENSRLLMLILCGPETLTNIEDLDEMPHNAAFHQGLHCFAKTKSIYRERNAIIKKYPQYMQ